jgi:hypothetical protein
MPELKKTFENSIVKIADMPEGYSGPGFMATSLDKAVGLHAAELNSWLPWPAPTTWGDMVLNDCHSRRARQIY